MDRYDNAPESANLTEDERVEVGAAREAWGSIKRTFDMWVTIGRGIQRLRAKADAIGGRRTFQRLMDQNGLGELCSPKLKAVTTRLLKIMDNLGPVGAWHNQLPPHQRVAWGSPSSVVRHCPVFATGKAKPKGDSQPWRMNPERALDAFIDAWRDKPVAQKRAALDRLTKALALDAPMREAAPDNVVTLSRGSGSAATKPAKAKTKAKVALLWTVDGDDWGRERYKAAVAGDDYSVYPSFDMLNNLKFVGYRTSHWNARAKERRDIGSAPTADKAKALAQRDYDRARAK